jgi:hypothetical protein
MLVNIFFLIAGLVGLGSASVPTCDEITTMSSTLLTTMMASDTSISLHALSLRLGIK